MSRNKLQQQQDMQVVSTIASFPFVMQIVHDGETGEVSAQMTQDRRYKIGKVLPADAEWVVLPQEVTG